MTDENRHNLFISQFAENQQRIRAFVLSLSPNWVEADDIFQRVSMVLWNKWDSYDQSRSFLGWALGVSRLEVLKYMSEKNRLNEVLSVNAIRLVEARIDENSEEVSERMKALTDCLAKLPGKKQSLIRRCYSGDEKIQDIAVALGITADAIYWRIKRIRETLHQCIDRRLALGDSTDE